MDSMVACCIFLVLSSTAHEISAFSLGIVQQLDEAKNDALQDNSDVEQDLENAAKALVNGTIQGSIIKASSGNILIFDI